MNGIGGLRRPAEAEIIFLFGLLFAFFARDIKVCFTEGINKFGFMVRRNIQGFLCGYKDGRETVMEKLACNTTRSAAYDYAGWVWIGAGVKNTLYFCSFGDRIGFTCVFLHCVSAIVYVNRSGGGVIKLLFGALGN